MSNRSTNFGDKGDKMGVHGDSISHNRWPRSRGARRHQPRSDAPAVCAVALGNKEGGDNVAAKKRGTAQCLNVPCEGTGANLVRWICGFGFIFSFGGHDAWGCNTQTLYMYGCSGTCFSRLAEIFCKLFLLPMTGMRRAGRLRALRRDQVEEAWHSARAMKAIRPRPGSKVKPYLSIVEM
jgi:hypothetical protein